MQGMNAKTGKPLQGIEHLKQSITDILATPIGSRVMLRHYGSRLPFLLDQPVNANLVTEIQASVVEALEKFEKRVSISRVTVDTVSGGQVNLTIEGFYLPDSRAIRLQNITIQ